MATPKVAALDDGLKYTTHRSRSDRTICTSTPKSRRHFDLSNATATKAQSAAFENQNDFRSGMAHQRGRRSSRLYRKFTDRSCRQWRRQRRQPNRRRRIPLKSATATQRNNGDAGDAKGRRGVGDASRGDADRSATVLHRERKAVGERSKARTRCSNERERRRQDEMRDDRNFLREELDRSSQAARRRQGNRSEDARHVGCRCRSQASAQADQRRNRSQPKSSTPEGESRPA